MLHVIFLLTAALHMLTRAADVALKPWLMISWRSVSAEHKLHPQDEDNKETLLTGNGWVQLFYLCQSPQVHLLLKSWIRTNI